MNMQRQIMKDLNIKPTIEPVAEIRERVNFLKAYVKKTKASGYVLGISGGQDSTLAGRIAQLAVEELRNEEYDAKFVAVRLPYGIQQDEVDAMKALEFIQPDESLVFNVKTSVDAMAEEYNKMKSEEPIRDYHKGNIKARARMMAQYAIGGMHNLLVIGTDHAAESVTGFYTKYGDGGADVLPLAGLTKRQGRELLKELKAEDALYLKVPTADLLDDAPGQADETELGITYEALDDFLEGKKVPSDVERKIIERYQISKHKRHMPATMYDSWWK